MTTPTSVFARHIDDRNGTRHRCVLIDERHLRCLDCDHTLVLPSGVASTSTSSRAIPNIDDPQACPQHPGMWAATCGPCRSERIAVPDGQTKPDRRPRATEPGPEWDATKQKLGARQDPPCSSPPPAQDPSTPTSSNTSTSSSTTATTSTSPSNQADASSASAATPAATSGEHSSDGTASADPTPSGERS